jgi:hypothetical protein
MQETTGFPWIPLYRELGRRLLEYENRRGELLAILRDLRKQGLPVITLEDQDASGNRIPLSEIDPFSFFASFNRHATRQNRIDILRQIKAKMGLESAVPEDFPGIPIVNPLNSWFISFSSDRSEDDVRQLWTLARQAVEHGLGGVEAPIFENCASLCGLPKLTIGLFWLRADEFLPYDSRTREFLKKRGLLAKVKDLGTYRALVEQVKARLSLSPAEISNEAYQEIQPPPPAHRATRYWAGGFQWGETSKLQEFIDGGFWQIGWDPATENPTGQKAWGLLHEIHRDDLLAIKGYGGKHDLKVHLVGQVTDIDLDSGRVKLTKLDRPLYQGKAPRGANAGRWRQTLLEVKRPEDIRLVFGEQNGPHVPSVGPETLPSLDSLVDQTLWERSALEEIIEAIRGPSPQIVLAGPPGTGKTWVAKALARFLTGDRDDRWQVVQLHPSYGYEEFVQGLRPVSRNGAISFDVVDGVVLRVAERIGASVDPFVLVVDEMNRANLPRVLGELLYLFEYRDEEIALQYTPRFKLPASLKFIGTMNTADRSIRSIDVALRRRFEVFECPPSRRILERYYATRVNEVLDLFDGFESLNQNLITDLDRHHTIGHTFFMAPGLTRTKLDAIWRRKIGPLIEEYFFDQPDLAAKYRPDAFWREAE